MKYLLTLVAFAVFSVASGSTSEAQVRISTGGLGFSTGNTNWNNTGSNSYGRRLNRYQNHYGYGNPGYGHYGNHGNGHRYGNYSNYGGNRYDYYGNNYGRVNDYRSYYGTNRGNRSTYYNGGYRSRAGFSIGSGRSRLYFGF